MEVISQTFLNNFLFLIKILSWCVIVPRCGGAAAAGPWCWGSVILSELPVLPTVRSPLQKKGTDAINFLY